MILKNGRLNKMGLISTKNPKTPRPYKSKAVSGNNKLESTVQDLRNFKENQKTLKREKFLYTKKYTPMGFHKDAKICYHCVYAGAELIHGEAIKCNLNNETYFLTHRCENFECAFNGGGGKEKQMKTIPTVISGSLNEIEQNAPTCEEVTTKCLDLDDYEFKY